MAHRNNILENLPMSETNNAFLGVVRYVHPFFGFLRENIWKYIPYVTLPDGTERDHSSIVKLLYVCILASRDVALINKEKVSNNSWLTNVWFSPLVSKPNQKTIIHVEEKEAYHQQFEHPLYQRIAGTILNFENTTHFYSIRTFRICNCVS